MTPQSRRVWPGAFPGRAASVARIHGQPWKKQGRAANSVLLVLGGLCGGRAPSHHSPWGSHRPPASAERPSPFSSVWILIPPV